MAMDKDLYRRVFALHAKWSDEKLLLRAEIAAKLSPGEAFRQYADLVEFCWQLAPQTSDWQRREKLQSLDQYYGKVQKLEAWRRARRQAA